MSKNRFEIIFNWLICILALHIPLIFVGEIP